MMYDNKLVAALKVGSKILREFQDTVYVPFGAEYSILIKNLNTVRVAVDIHIDGNEATEGVSLIVDPKEEFELTRYIKNGNLNSGNRFKFIERTPGIEQHRGIGMEDGIIRIEFQYERPQPVIRPSWHTDPCTLYGKSIGSEPTRGFSSNSFGDSMNGMLGGPTMSANQLSTNSITTQAFVNQVNDAGITVPGSVSDQKFSTVTGFVRDSTKHSMVLRLLGETAQGLVEQPILVKTKPVCQTCGRTNKATAKFCTNCGTSLQIV